MRRTFLIYNANSQLMCAAGLCVTPCPLSFFTVADLLYRGAEKLREKKLKSPETEASKRFKTTNLICMQRSADTSQTTTREEE